MIPVKQSAAAVATAIVGISGARSTHDRADASGMAAVPADAS
jgi:hypothetical protein